MAVDIEYVIRLNDKLSNKLRVVQTQVDKLNNKVNKTKSNFSGLAGTFARIGGTVALGMAAKAVVTLGANMEQTRVAFATFLGDAEKANVLIAQLNEFANVTPFNNEEIIKSGRLLLAAGIPAEKITDQLKQIGDVAAGANVPITELAAIFQKATNKGKLQAEELNQFSERGIPLLDELSKMFGKSKEEVLKLGSQGKITSGVMNQAFTNMTSEGGIFFNLMEKQSKTLGGRFSTLIGKLQTLGIAIGEALIPVLGVLTNVAIALVENTDVLKDLGIVIGIAVTAFGAFKVAMLVSAIATSQMTAAQWLLNIALNANPIGLVIAAIAALVAIVAIVIRHYETWGAALTFLLGPLGMVINMVQAFRRNWDDVKKSFSEGGFLDGLKKIGAVMLDSLLMPMQQLLELISNIPGLEGIAGKGAEKILALRERLGVRTGGAAATEGEGSLTGQAGAGTTTAGLSTTTGSGALGAKVSEVKANAPKVFNINIEKLVEALNISTTNLKDTSTRIKDEVERALLTAITDASIISE